MENTDRDKSDNLSNPEKAKAWIFTLSLGVAVCLGLIVYTFITHNPPIDLESSLYKPGFVWLGFIALSLSFVNYFLFGINTSLLKSLPDNKVLIDRTAISGIFSVLLTLLF